MIYVKVGKVMLVFCSRSNVDLTDLKNNFEVKKKV